MCKNRNPAIIGNFDFAYFSREFTLPMLHALHGTHGTWDEAQQAAALNGSPAGGRPVRAAQPELYLWAIDNIAIINYSPRQYAMGNSTQ